VSKGSTRRYRKARAAVLATATRCWICSQPARPGDPLVSDHVIPRSKGGPDIVGNLRPAHASCNLRKGATWPIEPAPPRVEKREPDPTPETHPHLHFKQDPETGKLTWYSRDW
jgi:5-methylcytosine-specific restriction endonuclease McrA